MGDEKQSPQPLLGFPLAAIMVTAFSVVVPFFWLGIPSGHDFEFHFNSWLEVIAHWKEGVVYPHWAALAHYGYGEARFIFYPPISWTLGAVLGLLLPWKLVSSAYIWLALTLCGASMFSFAKKWLAPRDALIAAIVYVVNPYHVVLVYWRSDMAELLASAYLPLLLLFVMRLPKDGRSAIAPLSLTLAAGWLTNVPTAVMMNYSLGFLALWLAISRRTWAVIAYATIAVALSAALAAIYLVPVLHQQPWINISQVLSPGVRPADNFLFTIMSDPDHNQFNRLASMVALWNIVVVAALLILSTRWRRDTLWRTTAAWGLMCMILMSRLTLPLWMHLPELRYVQFPWRWLICLNVVFATVIVMAFRRSWVRVAACLVALASVIYVWERVLPPWWDNSGDIQEMVDNQEDNIGNEGTDEYVPAGVDPYDIDQNAPQARFESPGTAQIRIEKWESEKKVISSSSTSPGELVLRLFNYPLWRVEVNRRAVRSTTIPHTGELAVPLSAGDNRVQISFSEGWDRKLGGAVSALAFAVVIFTLVTSRKSGRTAEC
jgi:6-pyruvoyl-tetrahydropterin synthase-like protein